MGVMSRYGLGYNYRPLAFLWKSQRYLWSKEHLAESENLGSLPWLQTVRVTIIA